jgi:tetratricopeptide (TPR) repeat protein
MEETFDSLHHMERIFHQALALPQGERAGVIAAACGGDLELAVEVQSLLAAVEEEALESSTRLAETAAGGQTEQASRAAHSRIGPYELDRLLGRGGTGAVYLAHRADGEFAQQVAIKLIDLPLATHLFRERFRQERQILAGLQHPYIARLLDGGVTADGDPWLAMEFVDGEPIHRYCERQQLTTRQRLELFVRVCEAVQFAHRNFIVHRDLKPDNILVAADGTPRLLDFGTAKLLSPTLAERGSEMTREGYRSFTPQYASPEQVLGKPITAASDTYSLGVLLYLLLTGTLPYDLHEMTMAEMIHVVCDAAPRKPLQEGTGHRRFDHDLEAILLKALRKEPDERYLTADQLLADLHAWLGGRPVAARSGSFRYRAGKFMRRNRLVLTGLMLLAASLLAGVLGVVWQASVANQQRSKAEARAADLRQLSNSLLSELDEAIKQLPGSTGVQKLLVTRVLEHLDRLARDAQGDRQTRLDLIDAYTRLGNLQGNVYDQNLGDSNGALASIDKAITLAAPLAAASPGDHEALRALALAQQSRSEVLFGAGKTPEAIASMQDATRAWERLIANAGATPKLICDAASAYGTLGDEFGQTGTASLAETAAALEAFHKSIALDDRALAIAPSFSRARRGLAINQMKIGSVEMESNPREALKDFQVALQRADALPKGERESLPGVRMRGLLQRKEANALVELGEYARAKESFAPAERIYRKLAAEDPQDLRAQADLQVILNDEAISFEAAADPALAVTGSNRQIHLEAAGQLLKQAVEIMGRMIEQDPSNEYWRAVRADAQVRLASIRFDLHPGKEDEAMAKAGIAVLREQAGKSQASAIILSQAANALLTVQPASLRDPAFALACAQREVALSHGKTASMLLTLAQAWRATGQIGKSREVAREGLDLLAPSEAGSAPPRLRRLLEIQERASR